MTLPLVLTNLILRYREWRARRKAEKAGDIFGVESSTHLQDAERQRLRQMLRDDVKARRLRHGGRPRW